MHNTDHYTNEDAARSLLEPCLAIPLSPGSVTLDPACGSGNLLSVASELFPECRLVGIEIDPSSAKIAKSRVPKAEIHIGDALFDFNDMLGELRIDICVMNPPFGGVATIRKFYGDPSILKSVCPHAKGQVDLSAYFVWKFGLLVRRGGILAVLATNTISQGATRRAALQPLVSSGFSLFQSSRDIVWGGSAKVVTSSFHAYNGDWSGKRLCDGVEVSDINSRLRPRPERADPVPLSSNDACSYSGSIIYGQGFTLTPEEREELLARDPKNAERIFTYLGGKEVNTHPEQMFDRYVISFGDMSLEDAEQWPDLLDIVRAKVKPERDKLRNSSTGIQRKKHWWMYGSPAGKLYAAIASLPRCLVAARITKHLMFSFQPTDRVLSDALYVFPLHNFTAFATLQSRVHEAWTRLLSSTLGVGLNYSATECFANFPFPEPDPRALIPHLEKLGQTLYDTRAKFMRTQSVGLTATYNRLHDPADHDPSIDALRQLHEALDAAVLQAYGWSDIPVPPFAQAQNAAERQAQQSFCDEVIDRLFALNAERSSDEQTFRRI